MWTVISPLLFIKFIQIIIALITNWLAQIVISQMSVPWLFEFHLFLGQVVCWKSVVIRILIVKRFWNMLFITLRILSSLVVGRSSGWSSKVHLFLRSSLMWNNGLWRRWIKLMTNWVDTSLIRRHVKALVGINAAWEFSSILMDWVFYTGDLRSLILVMMRWWNDFVLPFF